jgi:hypothetical protein
MFESIVLISHKNQSVKFNMARKIATLVTIDLNGEEKVSAEGNLKFICNAWNKRHVQPQLRYNKLSALLKVK